MPITKTVIFIAKKNSIDELKQLLTDMVKPSQDEDGCLLYHIYQTNQEPTKFVVIESWKDEAALDGHKNSQHYKFYKSHFEPFTADKYSDELTELQ